jgi:hypothetical protein
VDQQVIRAIAYNGGNWSNGSKAGLFYLNLNNEASNSNANNGGRLANKTRRKAYSHESVSRASLFGAFSPAQTKRANINNIWGGK